MGNCCMKGSRSTVGAETDDEHDQWVYCSDPNLQHKQSLLSDQDTENKSNRDVSLHENNNDGKHREVKIMLSKKKLEELLGKVEDLQNIPVDQILDRLIDSSDRFEFHDGDHYYHQAWKPMLSSIPEEN